MKCRLALVLCASLLAIPLKPAHAVDPVKAEELKVSRIGDVELSCDALSSEAGRMQTLISDISEQQEASEMQGHGITAATGIGGFLVGTVTGGIGFAAAGLLASQAIDADVNKAEDAKDTAAQRRSLMVGIYKAKECVGPIEHVMIDEPIKLAEIEPAAGKRQNRAPTYND